MSLNDANRLRRFITLVDCLYEHRAQLVYIHIYIYIYDREGFAAAFHPHPTHVQHTTPHKTQQVMLAEAAPAELFDAKANKESEQDEAFAYDRTVSRLMEMQVRGIYVYMCASGVICDMLRFSIRRGGVIRAHVCARVFEVVHSHRHQHDI